MSGLPIRLNRDDREDSGRRQLLAVHELRRDLECVEVAAATVRPAEMAVKQKRLVRDLLELIAALDRRVPRMERAGETSIARDAAALKARALERIAELEHETTLTESK